MEPVLLVLLFIGLLIAAYQDLRIREVPDTVSYGLITAGLLGGLALALIASDVWIFVEHALGFLVGLVIGLGMYYARQWGGGDAKLIMGVGAILGLSWENFALPLYFVLLIFAGACYGMCYTVLLALKHRTTFRPAFIALLRTPRVHRLRKGIVASGIVAAIAFFLVDAWTERAILVLFLAAAYLLFYGWLLIHTVERHVLLKRYPVGKLTEGDWIAEDVRIRGKLLVGKRSTGVTLEQIALLKRRKVRSVMVREGIPFVPSFLLAFLVLLLFEHAGVTLATLLG